MFQASVRVKIRFALLAMIAALVGNTVACGGTFSQQRLTAMDATPFDSFGSTVASYRNTAVVGAPGNDEAAPAAGAAYLFDLTSGRQRKKLLADDATRSDAFGSAVAIHGNLAVVGAMHAENIFELAGAAYVFDINTGDQLRKILPSNPGPVYQFGNSVAADGKLAAVGSRRSNVDGVNLAGAVYLFDLTTGRQIHRLTANDVRGQAFFGHTIALSGDTLIVGAPGDSEESKLLAGAAYLFNAATGEQLFKLRASDASRIARFGTSVAVDDSIAVIGAPVNDSNLADPGTAYVFDVETGEELMKLTPPSLTERASFGQSVAIGSEFILVGAERDDRPHSDSGAGFLFDRQTGNFVMAMTPTGLLGDSRFGGAAFANSGRFVIGARRGGESKHGIVYTFVVPEPSSSALLLICVTGTLRVRKRA